LGGLAKERRAESQRRRKKSKRFIHDDFVEDQT
jgi:hypothetical protein